jgi:rhamnosyltransferase subunit B
MSRILLLPFGSRGDVNPYLGIGIALKERGHTVTVLTNRMYEDVILRTGLSFSAIGTEQSARALLRNADVWDPGKGWKVLMRFSMDWMPETFQKISDLHQSSNTILLAPRTVLAAFLAHEKLGIPLVCVSLSPLEFRSRNSPAKLPALVKGQWSGMVASTAIYRLLDRQYHQLLAPHLNSFRRELGLAEILDVNEWVLRSPTLAIGLWPEWFYSPQSDWPARSTVADFVEYDDPCPTVAGCVADSSPIVFTAGTAVTGMRSFFTAAAAACVRLGRPGLLLTANVDEIPRELPSSIEHACYLPLREVLSKASALVHHGGIGTAARGLRAGVPQLIVPTAFDQFDNCNRLIQLGVATSLARADFTDFNVAALLDAMWHSDFIRERCEFYSQRFAESGRLARTCQLIEFAGSAG